MNSENIQEAVGKIMVGLSPEPSSDRLESPRSTLASMLTPCGKPSRPGKWLKSLPPVKNEWPLKTPWQQRRLNLDASPAGVQETADAIESWCKNFAARGKGNRVIVLSGPFGCAKTHCLTAARRYVRDVSPSIWPEPWGHPPRHHSVNWADFIRDVCENECRAVFEDLIEADAVFLDDIGSEEDRFKSGAPTRILGDVLGRIHDEKKFAFITTNIQAGEWRSRWDARVYDRLLRMNPIAPNVWQSGESYAVWKMRNGHAA